MNFKGKRRIKLNAKHESYRFAISALSDEDQTLSSHRDSPYQTKKKFEFFLSQCQTVCCPKYQAVLNTRNGRLQSTQVDLFSNFF